LRGAVKLVNRNVGRNVGVDAVCQICKDGGRDEFMLLCEACDVGYHYDCLTPPLKGAFRTRLPS
jgi:hypothetical protein